MLEATLTKTLCRKISPHELVETASGKATPLARLSNLHSDRRSEKEAGLGRRAAEPELSAAAGLLLVADDLEHARLPSGRGLEGRQNTQRRVPHHRRWKQPLA